MRVHIPVHTVVHNTTQNMNLPSYLPHSHYCSDSFAFYTLRTHANTSINVVLFNSLLLHTQWVGHSWLYPVCSAHT